MTNSDKIVRSPNWSLPMKLIIETVEIVEENNMKFTHYFREAVKDFIKTHTMKE